ncbi:MAG TPA: DUF1127 domain-containing protein [Gemmataceae bacterium]|nr:DUF1127 domain-containing protein [Gemmataceae bacterium]
MCMSCARPADEAGASSRLSTLAARAGALVRKAWRTYWDWRARQVTILILQSLDCRTLHDIGIAPGEIRSLVHGAGDRCRRYDAAWPWRPSGGSHHDGGDGGGGLRALP